MEEESSVTQMSFKQSNKEIEKMNQSVLIVEPEHTQSNE